MTRRQIRRRVRALMRLRERLRTYAGPVAPGYPERVEADIRAWAVSLTRHFVSETRPARPD